MRTLMVFMAEPIFDFSLLRWGEIGNGFESVEITEGNLTKIWGVQNKNFKE